MTTGADRYRRAGVDLAAAEAAKAKIAELVRGTRTAASAGAVGAFGGLVRIPADVPKPLLVASTDGVGTKVLVAIRARRHDTIGEDLVNHCVNDILVHAARPIGFLDYFASGRLDPAVAADVVSGVARACRAHEMPLVGGETAEMPDVYRPGEFDLAGTIVGVVAEDEALHGDRVRRGRRAGRLRLQRLPHQRLLAAAPGAVRRHGAGSRRPVPRRRARRWARCCWRCTGATSPPSGRSARRFHALAHITGGGIPGNLVRVLPATTRCGGAGRIVAGAGAVPRGAGGRGGGRRGDARTVFNLGVGLIGVCAPGEVERGARGGARGRRRDVGDRRGGAGAGPGAVGAGDVAVDDGRRCGARSRSRGAAGAASGGTRSSARWWSRTAWWWAKGSTPSSAGGTARWRRSRRRGPGRAGRIWW